MIVPELADRITRALRVVPDFPEPGILFRDITPLLGDAALFADVVEAMTAPYRRSGITHVVGVESRGFMFGAPVALSLRASFVPVRKPGKLPFATLRERYVLEYRTDALEVHRDAFGENARVLIVDDVLATGGTAAATAALVQRLDATVAGLVVLAELTALDGRGRLPGVRVQSLVAL